MGCLVYLVYLYYPLSLAIVNYKFKAPTENVSAETAEVFLEEVEEEEQDKEFRIQIPKILAAADIAADVSPYNPNEYLSILSDNRVAHSELSDKPGSGPGNSVYIFAHSTEQGINMARKNSVFYLLGELAPGDKVHVKYGGRVFIYEVFSKKVVAASEIKYLEYREADKEMLILQTCWPIGTDWKRLLVFGKLLN